jgi:hypothetical protein
LTTKAQNQAVTGEGGVHRIAQIVDAMDHLWHPTVGVDSGIDGEIELRDAHTGEVRNVRIGVQSRATERKWDRETDKRLSYRPDPKQVAYWLSSNQPVLLICVRPSTGEAYWRSVQEWARDPEQRATGYIRFDKERDRFDVDAREALFDLKASAQDRVEPPGPVPQPEELLTNQMPLTWRTDTVWSAAVPTSDARALFGPAWERGLGHSASALREGRLWSFAPFDERFSAAIGASEIRSDSLSLLLAKDDGPATNLLKELVVRSLIDRHAQLRWHAFKRVAYFRRGDEYQEVRYQWTTGKGRAVVSPQLAKAEDHHFMGYRHEAAELTVRRLDELWTLQITPTYLFTWDGNQLSGHHDKALAGIKKMDRHRAVSAQLRMWEHLLLERPDLLRPEGHADFALGDLLKAKVPFGINEKAWEKLPDDDAEVAQGSFFELDDYLAP